MSYRLLTCPETAHLEMIEHEEHPLGLLIVGCSRFRPACLVTCARTCAVRLDRRARRGTLDDEPTLDDGGADEVTDVHDRGIDLSIETDVTTPGDATRCERPRAATAPR